MSESKEKRAQKDIASAIMERRVQKPKRGAGFGVEAGSEGGVGQVYDVFIGGWDQ